MSIIQPTSSFVPAAGGLADHNGENWTEQEIVWLTSLVRDEGLSNVEAAVRMGAPNCRSHRGVALRRPDPRANLRTCMPCRRPFFSMHIGNRVCGQCIKRHSLECA